MFKMQWRQDAMTGRRRDSDTAVDGYAVIARMNTGEEPGGAMEDG